MEKLADKVEKMLEGMLSLYKELECLLVQEKGYIVDMAVDALWETTAQKKRIALNLEKLQKIMRDLLEKRAAELNMDAAAFTFSEFIQRMPDSDEIKSDFRKHRIAVETCKKNAMGLAAANKKYIEEHLSMISGIFSLIAETVHKKQYTRSGTLMQNREKTRLIHAEV